MARSCQIQKQKRDQEVVKRYAEIRNELKALIKPSSDRATVREAYKKLRALPRNSSPTRLVNRCFVSGRARSFIRLLGASRIIFRQVASTGTLAGFEKHN